MEIFVLDRWSVSVDEDERHFLSCHQKLVSNPKKEKSIVFRGEKLAEKKKRRNDVMVSTFFFFTCSTTLPV